MSELSSSNTTTTNTNPLLYGGTINITTRTWSDMEKGGYHVIGHIILQFQNRNNETIRMDVSNVVPHVVGAAMRPEIQTLSQGNTIFLSIVIGIASIISLSMFLFIVYHRNHKVMTMAQAGLLGWLAFASFTTITFSFLLMPIQDIFCEIHGLLFIPATMMPAILVGRLWRVHSTLSVAQRLGRGISAFESSSRRGGDVADDQNRDSTLKKLKGQYNKSFESFRRCCYERTIFTCMYSVYTKTRTTNN